MYSEDCLFYYRLDTRGPGGVLGISSDGDDRRPFLGLKFSIPGFIWVRKFGKYFFGYLDLSRDFLRGIEKNR